MAVCATVLIPTHNHGPTLFHAVRSALAQTVREIEVFIVGDGASDATREVAAQLVSEDGRVRFFDNPKGPNRGEVHRHAALAHAQGRIVCYLPDDDLWLPDHVETVQGLLRQADFAHTLPMLVQTDGLVEIRYADLQLPFFRQLILTRENRIPFPCGAHTLQMYRNLPGGWRTTPEGPLRDLTDLHMWRQFLAQPECRAVSASRPTALTFPSPWRQGWTIGERLEELDRWSQRLADPGWRRDFVLAMMDRVVRDRASMEVQFRELEERLLDLVGSDVLPLAQRNEELATELEAITRLPSWRLRRWVLRCSPAARLNLWVGRVLVGRSGR